MDDSARRDHETIRVVLEGGPTDLPSEMHLQPGTMNGGRLKLPYRGGYEHFELIEDDGPAADSSPRLRWTMRTKIAE